MRLFGVIGSPIDHSLSPFMHTAAFKALQLDACYAPFEVPKKALPSILEGLMLAGVEGLNVTVPLKEAVVPLMDRLDPAAAAMGAVNTIIIQGKRKIGYNTDAVGFTRALKELGWIGSYSKTSQGKRRQVVVLGAGGSARAVCWALAQQRGLELTIANRRVERAVKLCRWLKRVRPKTQVQTVPLRRVRLDTASLLVNATSLGMRAGDASPVDTALLHRGLYVYDLVYNRPTRLVKAARRRGCVASDGLSMLLYQGVESLRLWVRRAPPVGVMRKALIRAVKT